MDDAVTVCPQCGTRVAADDRFCEECGADLPRVAPAAPGGQSADDLAVATGAGTDAATGVETGAETDAESEATAPLAWGRRAVAPRTCHECGGEIDPDGYCTQCGAKAPRPRDHLASRPAAWVAAVSDRGIRHDRNEDAAAVVAEPADRAALVVCDGVSSAADSDVASLEAARAAAGVLAGSAGLATGSALAAALGARIGAAAAAAASAVAAATSDGVDSPPSCTFVAAAVQLPVVVVGVVGDSRAYWLPDDDEPVLLTLDDSVAGQQIAAGRPRAEAEAGPQAHAITRWLGVDSPDEKPRLTTLEVDRAGWLVLCSDGLWNYCSEAAALREQLRSAAAAVGEDPLDLASALVDWANEQGGHDNITVVLARLGADGTRPAGGPAEGAER
ncbi:protein phosphatase 2C domain-containing protein [Actinotalea sp. M2MS4P-6]|uniref:PP2C family serine/threonine-protein phosphatase n=1 Tax=Actinotalea sp. M2MS4P-6 TaxID=2983762 RepID=UPI0021E4C105|nr:protein phosphatase 2C domain-containing protein [Actinotalea sp. M2MS4P-6]MCV2393047.1 protein phosphatase 2C domain-containing protein [Actinotalea sp. M2MS4P-6]